MTKQQAPQTAFEVIRNRRRLLYIKKGYISLVMRFLFLAIAGYLLFTQVFLITRAKGNDMFPAVKDGDLVISFRMQQEYVKKDVVVFKLGGTTHLGRIVARENDVVYMDDTGTLLVNNAVQQGEIIYPTIAKEEIVYPFKVPESNLFLLGDHRTEAYDSRDFGAVAMSQVQGKVITIIRRRGV